MQILAALDADFLARAKCYFGGGTRIALALAEYRESADIDLLCADREGYRDLRSTVTGKSLGRIARGELALAREVVADRYGIRTFVQVEQEKIKFEIVGEGRITITGDVEPGCPIPVLTHLSCFAEKFLANADRWNDESFLGRDVIDLAFMAATWDPADAAAGLAQARDAYGKVVEDALKKAVQEMSERKDYLKRCTAGLGVEDTRTLARGLRALSAIGTGKKTRARSSR
jgi:hypothetical protein